ncbi:hypothetical protein B296_00022412 [Ensete ventricosum]|uniref:Uncharacterized protein n=1 Tax=Ensete ventricosum TaxID=4639 RepID=A0A427AYB0_ENSVE|nr:hypothetical protein B296_00022412 [Ensete ventricosum]
MHLSMKIGGLHLSRANVLPGHTTRHEDLRAAPRPSKPALESCTLAHRPTTIVELNLIIGMSSSSKVVEPNPMTSLTSHSKAIELNPVIGLSSHSKAVELNPTIGRSSHLKVVQPNLTASPSSHLKAKKKGPWLM